MSKDATILVAVLNKKETIKICLDSLLSQDIKPAKIMIIDGGSTDGTYNILKSYQDKIDLIKFEPTSLSVILNWALDNIRTEYVAITDADCVVEKNWLSELLKGFDENGVIASAGYCGTPLNVSFFQKLVGMELENRFKKFPRYISRAPTMNLCLKTEVARQVKFDPNQKVDVETDFGYRLTRKGKMVYIPSAKVFHYHRASLKGYFFQQRDYAKWGVRLLLRHKQKAMADHITTLTMTAQIPVFSLALFFLLTSFIKIMFLYYSIIFFIILFFIYLKNIIEINPSFRYYAPLFGLFFLRNCAWIAGLAEGTLSVKEMNK